MRYFRLSQLPHPALRVIVVPTQITYTAMSKIHDASFKDIIGNRDMAVLFLQEYMPPELTMLINWKTI